MHWALLGDHPDGLDLALALAASGRHAVTAYSGPGAAVERLRQGGATIKPVGDVEEILADPAIDAVIVAARSANRPELLRRALQSERHVVCVYPPDHSPDIAYEAAMIQTDTRKALVPLLPEGLHPAVARLAELVRSVDRPLGEIRLIEMERWATGSVWMSADRSGHRPSFPGWDVLRRLGGEIREVSAFAVHEELVEDEPLVLSGRFESGGLFQMSLVPQQFQSRWRLVVVGSRGRAELSFAGGWPGPARLTWQADSGESHEEHWPDWDPWPVLIQVFESAAGLRPVPSDKPLPRPMPAETAIRSALADTAIRERPPVALEPKGSAPWPSWQDAIRSLELDDAARRSLAHRRASALEYPEATEEVGFKGTMTLIGCATLWIILVLLILAAWFPHLGWMILPLLVLFLFLQLLRWVIPRQGESKKPPAPKTPRGDG